MAFLLVTLVGGGVALWQLNQRGFSGEWSERLSKELARLGLHAEFSTARLSWTRGLVAKDLRIYKDEQKSEIVASVDELQLDIDRNEALRGNWEVRSASFENAFVNLPDTYHPHELRRLNGQAHLGRDKVLTLEDATAELGSLLVRLDVRLTDFQLNDLMGAEAEEEERPIDDFTLRLLSELALWTLPEEARPELAVAVEGSLGEAQNLVTHFHFSAPHLLRRDYEMRDLSVEGRLTAGALDLENMSFADRAGHLQASGYYDFRNRKADFETNSSADLATLLRDGLGLDLLEELSYEEPPLIKARGEVSLPAGEKPLVSLLGHLQLGDFRFLGEDWQGVDSDFSWQAGDLFLRDLVLTHAEGRATGKLLLKDDNIRYQARSTLPVKVFDPFLAPDGDITKIVASADFDEESKVRVDIRGTIKPSDLTDWSSSGTAIIENFRFNDVPINHLSATFNCTPLQAVYSSPEVELDLTEDPSFKRFGGPESAIVRADQISYDHTVMLTRIEHLHGVCWPAAVMRAFLPETAGYIERTYRSTEPPGFSSSGIIDHRPPRDRTYFLTRFQSDGELLYDFLGETVTLQDTSALVETKHREVTIRDFNSYTFSGPIRGEVSILLPNRKGRAPDFRGHMLWTRLRLAEIGHLYGFEKIEKGLVTGRFDFMGTAGRVESLEGSGTIGLEQGELFKAPIFGPLSPLISGIQGHKNASHETARDASANFIVQKGILYTNDFITTTDSLTVRAQGAIDLARKTLDMTAQADTRGLLGLVTLPITVTPFRNLFQFRGTGLVSDPQWENTPFQKQNDTEPLVPPPPRAVVVPE
ncbi:MAG: AsmA-like C-terminal region-containing protein [Verrucomicrobiota bacterium JB023]|nr:AsmA-like C-terminal region-containing protein [Verrucomicrobiota bacterium JB023]